MSKIKSSWFKIWEFYFLATGIKNIIYKSYLLLFICMSLLKRKLRLHSFTLMELLYVMGIIGLIMPAMFALYNFMIKANREISARQSSIQQWYEFFERLNIMVQDYRIDYEEYYNRQMVWCNDWWGVWTWFKWYVGTWWNCTKFTTYWNWNSTERQEWSYKIKTWYHDLYYCSTERTQNAYGRPLVEKSDEKCGIRTGVQSYGQYATLFTNVKWWLSTNIVWDWDDEDVWYLLNDNIKSIQDGDNIQELYLISQDWKNRLYFRRKLVSTNGNYTQYKIQMLRLKWFDAWRLHDLDKYKDDKNVENRWVYDWKIDTWACDYSMWFIWHWDPVSTWVIYSGYYLPADIDDCWIDMTYWATNVLAWNLSVSPTWNPDLYWADGDRQINDYIKIFIVNGVYMPAYWATMAASIADFSVPLQTTINMEAFYK